MSVVQSTFKPEFLNRLDDVIVFDALTTDELTEIVELQVAAAGRRLAGRRLTLDVTPAAKEWLAVTGFDPVYGARPLRRLIQSAIGDKLARDADRRRDHRRRHGARRPGRGSDALCGAAAERALGDPAAAGEPGSGLVEQGVVTVLGQPEVVADAVAQAEQQPQLGCVTVGSGWSAASAAQAQLDPGGRPVQGGWQVRHARPAARRQDRRSAGHADPRSSGASSRACASDVPAEQEQRPGQRHPRVNEDRAAVGHGAAEVGDRLGRVIGEQPLLARPGGTPRPAASLALGAGRRQLGHLARRGQ